MKNLGDTLIVLLIGTSVGFIYEVSFHTDCNTTSGNGVKSVSIEKSCRVAHKFESSISITSLCMESIVPFHPPQSTTTQSTSNTPTSASYINNSTITSTSTFSTAAASNCSEQQLVILCGTHAPTRLYNFVGSLTIAKLSFISFFASLKGESSFNELPSMTALKENESFRSKSSSSSSRLQCYCSSRAVDSKSQTPLTMTSLTTATAPTTVKVTGLSAISNFGIGISKGLGRQTSTTLNSSCDTDNSGLDSNNSLGHTDRKDGQIFALVTHLGIYHGPLSLYDTYVH